MTKLVINADDFGYSKAINYGIIETHQTGVLTSTTMMANMPGLNHAASLAKENKALGIGAHLALTCGRPLLVNDKLTQINGEFMTREQLKKTINQIDLEAVYLEWQAQIEQLKKVGIDLTHLDTHHYVHGMGKLWQPMEALAKKYSLPIRNCLNVKEKLKNPSLAPADDLWLMFIDPAMKKMEETYDQVKDDLLSIIERDAKKYCHYSLIEANCHPGYLDTTVLFGSSFTVARLREIELLCDPMLRELLAQLGYELIRYNQL